MLLPGPVELACAKGESRRSSATETRRSSTSRESTGPSAAFAPAGLLILCRGNAASPDAERRLDVRSPHHHTDDDPRRRRPHASSRRGGPTRAEPRHIAGEGASRHPALGLPLAERVHTRTAGEGAAGRCRACHVPPRRAQAGARRARRPDDAALRPLGRGDDRRDVPRDPAGHAAGRSRVRILLVSQMYPGPDDPDLGVFVASLERELARARARDRARGRRHAAAEDACDTLPLVRDAARAARRFRPDVVYAHFLVPAGLAAALATRAPLVVTAHGQDVDERRLDPRRAGSDALRRPPSGRGHRGLGLARASARARQSPRRAGKTEVVDCGVDLERFAPRDRRRGASRPRVARTTAPRSSASARSPSERTSSRLARAFEARGEGTLDLRRRRAAARGARGPERNPARRSRRP